MKKIVCIVLLFPLTAIAQFQDDFYDNDFVNNPCWSGNINHFEVNSSGQLHLLWSGTDTSFLSTPSAIIFNTEWIFYVKQSFNSSANNFSRIYLTSDMANLKDSLNGYFIQIGGSDDCISLFRQEEMNTICIIEGTIAYTGNTTNIFKIKVTRNTEGSWKLYTDENITGSYQLEGTVNDTTIVSPQYFGIFCKYTSSNSTKFYFDDFIVRYIQIDSISPLIKNIKAVNEYQLDIEFSEPIEPLSAENANHYFINQGMGNPLIAVFDSNTHSIVHLFLPTALSDGNNYQITVWGISDMEGNVSDSLYADFSYYVTMPHEILINEIMADPDPTVGLPPNEYIELFNLTSHIVNLEGWSLVYGSSTKYFPEINFLPDSYMLITKDDATDLWQSYGPVLGIFTSASSLSNSGTSIILKNAEGKIIHAVSFTSSWYNNTYKAEGGWSLEMIDPQNPCGEIKNWQASVDMNGGSPGRRNSVYHENPDYKSPDIKSIGIIDSYNIMVYFDEALDSIGLEKTDIYFIDKDIGQPLVVILQAPHYNAMQLKLPSALIPETIYSLMITDTITDCAGNMIPIYCKNYFAIPEIASPLDIIINEVLFNPRDQGVDFVEIYNRSDKIIDMNDLILTTYDESAQLLASAKNISEIGFLIFPGDYYVLTEDPDVVMQQYFTYFPKHFIKMPEFPVFANEHGIVVIAKRDEAILDKFSYDENMQFPLLISVKGVSLERLSSELSTETNDNWHSASESSGYATPAYKNSQNVDLHELNENISIEPEIFSPDNDGYYDVLLIRYHFDDPGYVANVFIYDVNGSMIIHLANNELLGTEGSFIWNGMNANDEKATIGLYIIFIEVFNTDGIIKRYKKIVVLAGKL